MTSKKDAGRAAKLAAALKDNLKRRKAQAKARSFEAPRGPRGTPQDDSGTAKALGTAPQAGLEDQPQKGPNAAKKGG